MVLSTYAQQKRQLSCTNAASSLVLISCYMYERWRLPCMFNTDERQELPAALLVADRSCAVLPSGAARIPPRRTKNLALPRWIICYSGPLCGLCYRRLSSLRHCEPFWHLRGHPHSELPRCGYRNNDQLNQQNKLAVCWKRLVWSKKISFLVQCSMNQTLKRFKEIEWITIINLIVVNIFDPPI